MLGKTSGTLQTTVAGYFASVWNRFDMAVYLLLIISVILRYTVPDKDFVWARMFYALTLCLFFLRFLYTFFVEKNIGPKVIMIRRMVSCHNTGITFKSQVLVSTELQSGHFKLKATKVLFSHYPVLLVVVCGLASS